MFIELVRLIGQVFGQVKFNRRKKEMDKRWRATFRAKVKEDSATEFIPVVPPTPYQDSGVGGAQLFTRR